MRILVLTISILLCSLIAHSRDTFDIERFSGEFNRNMNSVIRDNPELYETTPINIDRNSASIPKEDPINEKFDDFDPQANGAKKW
jgi:hypothetical protein